MSEFDYKQRPWTRPKFMGELSDAEYDIAVGKKPAPPARHTPEAVAPVPCTCTPLPGYFVATHGDGCPQKFSVGETSPTPNTPALPADIEKIILLARAIPGSTARSIEEIAKTHVCKAACRG